LTNSLSNGIKERLFYTLGKRPDKASLHDFYMALSYAVRDQIINAINAYEPRAQLINLDVDARIDRNDIRVRIEYQVVNTSEFITFSTTISRLR